MLGVHLQNLADKKGMGRIVERVVGDKAKTDNTFNVWENGKKANVRNKRRN